MRRRADLASFYDLLGALERKLGGKRQLDGCDGRMGWPDRGVYFFFENGETRADSGTGPRVVRVGTHALKTGSRTTLWTRLSQHRGTGSVRGNHRGSIFRLLVGTALMRRDGLTTPSSWGLGSDPGQAAKRLGVDRSMLREQERDLEQAVNTYIRSMSILWLRVDDPPGPESLRGFIERNAIALLSNAGRQPLDAPSADWLGHHSDRVRVRSSGLWNNNHVDEDYDPRFLELLDGLIEKADKFREGVDAT